MKHKYLKRKWETLRASQKPRRLHKDIPKWYNIIAKAKQHFGSKIIFFGEGKKGRQAKHHCKNR